MSSFRVRKWESDVFLKDGGGQPWAQLVFFSVGAQCYLEVVSCTVVSFTHLSLIRRRKSA
jgi:hypothetical protein